MRKLWVLAALLAACGGGGGTGDDGVSHDAAMPDAAPPDALYPACAEFATPEQTLDMLPLAVMGDLAGDGADIAAPICAVVDAPFGQSSDGADAVFAVTGLDPGQPYVVRLSSDDDLAFYVVTGCSAATGPAGDECLLFEDAQTSQPEVGLFTPTTSEVYVVVDYYAAGYPTDTGFTLQVYTADCDTSASCGGRTPVCQDHRCVGCATDFDCTDPAFPVCDQPTFACVAGPSGCIGDDAAEDGDDGPAGASVLAADSSDGGAICDNPFDEHDFFRFHVDTPGEDWQLQLDWTAGVDLDLYVYDPAGNFLGASLYEHPERIGLTYLPVGDYLAMVDEYTQGGATLATSYTISATRVGDTCTSVADCAADFRNQIFRGDCVGGACVRIDGNGAVAAGDRCDSGSDCASGTGCSSFYFVADADTRMVCGADCVGDADCAGMGAGYVCTDYLAQNICVQQCTTDAQCPTDPSSTPQTPPWRRYSCQTQTGKCIP